MQPRCQRVRVRTLLYELLRDRGGAAMVEAGFILPAIIVLSLGAIETGRAVSAKAAINHAAKETARYAAVRGEASEEEATEASLKSMAIELANLPASSLTASITWDPDNSPGSLVLVQLQHTFTSFVPFLPGSLGLSSTASMTIIR